MGNGEIEDELEEQLTIILEGFRQRGMNSWQLLGVMIRFITDLYLRAGIEYRIKGGK